VLFADLVGFTPISEARDAEDVRELLSRYFETARTIVDRYGGVVEKFIGDAVMAVWGAPVAVEGDTERAVRAGLDLVDAVAALASELAIPELAVRAGITTGEVAVNLGVVGEGMVAGDAVNTAARIQTAATPGAVWVDAATRRMAEAAIDFEPEGEHLLKGKAGPVELWRASRVLAGVGGQQRIDGLEAPLLGRDAELRTIKEMFHASQQRRTPRLVVVTGPVGVGKSRLGWEFEKYVDGLSGTVLWHRGRCPAYGDALAFSALTEIVRQRLGIAEDDPGDAVGTKLAAGLAELFPDPGERGYVEPRLGRLLGAPVDQGSPSAALTGDELFAGWRLFFERLAAQKPVAMLLEDAQHADAGLLDFVDHLVEWARDVPIFLLVFARPELLERRPGFGAGRNRLTLALDPLDTTSMSQLLEALVPGMPTSAHEQLAIRAQGNPLFAVETIRSLVDRDIVVPVEGRYRMTGDPGELAVPESLRGLLSSRLDALGGELRQLVAKASVLGATFQGETLAALSDSPSEVASSIQDLVRREIFSVVTDPLSPQRGSYGFTQDMLREVAYETLSRRDRKALHLQVAAHLSDSYENDGEEVSEVIAQHCLAALEAIPDAPDVAHLRDRSIDALVRSAERRIRAGSPRSAAAAYRQAAEVALASGGTPLDRVAQWWVQAAENAYNAAQFDDCVSDATRAIDLFNTTDEARAAARCRVLAGRALGRLGRHTEAHHLLTEAAEVLVAEPDRDTVLVLEELAFLGVMKGSPDAAPAVGEALSLAQALDVDDSTLAGLFIVLGISLSTADRHHEALAATEYAVRLAERADDGRALGLALLNLADLLSPTEPARAIDVADRARHQARRAANRDTYEYAAANLAVALLERGEWSRAQEILDESADENDDEDGVFNVLDTWRSVLAALRGDVASANRHAELPLFRHSEDPQDLTQAALCDAMIAQAETRPGDALRHCRTILESTDLLGIRAESIRWSWPVGIRAARALGDSDAVAWLLGLLDARPDGHLPPVLRAERKLARAMSMAQQQEEGADDAWADALQALRRNGNPFNLARGLSDRAELLLDAQRRDEAGPLIGEAREIAERLGCAWVVAGLPTVGEQQPAQQPLGSDIALVTPGPQPGGRGPERASEGP
jgi:class 3 adenylate cyclase/tetratricopeptide (TPR) repeat protein